MSPNLKTYLTVTASRGHLKQAGVTARPRYVAISVHEAGGGVAVGVTGHGGLVYVWN